MFKVKNIILSLALLGCSGLAQAQQVEQRIDSLQILIGQQTVRHSYISSLLGIPHILVAINKMDLVDFRRQEQHLSILQWMHLK